MAKSHPVPKPPQERLLNVRQAALRLGYAPQSIYNALWGGVGPLAKLPHYRVGRSIRFSEADILAFIARHRIEPDDPGR
jgi:predicted DNA-binding transcriptional regulator AlpA